jgi:thiol-disulfide isomerase/thioredoxin
MVHKTKSKNSDKLVIGKVYANWCGHCQHLAPRWEIMKKTITQKCDEKGCEKPVIKEFEESNLDELEKFNEDNKEKWNGEKIEASGYPTIFKIENGKIQYYGGNREPEPLEAFMMNNYYKENDIKEVHTTGGKKRKGTNKKSKRVRKTRKSNKYFFGLF